MKFSQVKLDVGNQMWRQFLHFNILRKQIQNRKSSSVVIEASKTQCKIQYNQTVNNGNAL